MGLRWALRVVLFLVLKLKFPNPCLEPHFRLWLLCGLRGALSEVRALAQACGCRLPLWSRGRGLGKAPVTGSSPPLAAVSGAVLLREGQHGASCRPTAKHQTW